jgi:hypothetical protein
VHFKGRAKLSGVVEGVDLGMGEILLRPVEGRRAVRVRIEDLGALIGIHLGSRVTVEAVRSFFGGWEAASVSITR